MALTKCSDCGRDVSDVAQACSHCGRPMSRRSPLTALGLADANPGKDTSSARPAGLDSSKGELVALFPFFPVPTHKFVVLSLCTFGVYDLYWSYKNWQRIRERTGEKISPFWRAFWAPFWGFSLFGRIRDYARAESVNVSWSAGLLGTIYLVLFISWRLPDPWWLISLGSFIPLIAVVQTTHDVNSRVVASEDPNISYSGANIAMIVVGGLVLVLAIIGTFVPAI
jgi:hypothetical protein